MAPSTLTAPDDPTLALTADPAARARPGLLRLARQWLPARDDADLQALVDDALAQALDDTPPHALHATVAAALRDAALDRPTDTTFAHRRALPTLAAPQVAPPHHAPDPAPIHPRRAAAVRSVELARDAVGSLADRLPALDGRMLRRAGAAAAVVAVAGLGGSALLGGGDDASPSVATPPLRGSLERGAAVGDPSEVLAASHLAKERASRELVQQRAAELLRAERREQAHERAQRLARQRAAARERRRAAARRERQRSSASTPATSIAPPAITPTPVPTPTPTPTPTPPAPSGAGGGSGGGGGGWQFEFAP